MNIVYDNIDNKFMEIAIRLARRNIGKTGENPSVGAIIVKKYQKKQYYIVGSGVTAIGGRPHAEVIALKNSLHKSKNATLYVTLEPCSHYGKTPPCINKIISFGIKRVVIATRDPDNRVNGNGIKYLKYYGIKVTENILTDLAKDTISSYLCKKTLNRPEVTVKLAISSDYCIGKKNFRKFYITNKLSRIQSNILRTKYDAILVGIGTVKIDNPLLTCRMPGLEKYSPIRIILDSNLQISLDSMIIKSTKQSPVWIICSKYCKKEKIKILLSMGCFVFIAPLINKKIDLSYILNICSNKGINSILVEGGSKIINSFFQYSFIDKLILFYSAKKVGQNGYSAPSFIRNLNDYQEIYKEKFLEDYCIHFVKRT